MIPARMPVLLLAALCLSPTPAHAQIGPLIDWINKMSGPKFWGIETSLTIGHRPGQLMPEVTGLHVGAAPERDSELAACTDALDAISGEVSNRMFEEKRVDRLRASIDRIDGRSADLDTAAQRVLACAFLDQVLETVEHEVPRWGLFVRLGLVGAVNEKSESDEPEIYLAAFQPTAGIEVQPRLGANWYPAIALEAGMTMYQFFGGIDDFRHHSVLTMLSVRPFASRTNRIARAWRLGGGLRGFPMFDADAFGPNFNMPTEWEWVGTFFLGFDFTIGY